MTDLEASVAKLVATIDAIADQPHYDDAISRGLARPALTTMAKSIRGHDAVKKFRADLAQGNTDNANMAKVITLATGIIGAIL